nr:immunoglobulin light chain junction region [Macaca mulatta]
CLHYSSGPYSF